MCPDNNTTPVNQEQQEETNRENINIQPATNGIDEQPSTNGLQAAGHTITSQNTAIAVRQAVANITDARIRGIVENLTARVPEHSLHAGDDSTATGGSQLLFPSSSITLPGLANVRCYCNPPS